MCLDLKQADFHIYEENRLQYITRVRIVGDTQTRIINAREPNNTCRAPNPLAMRPVEVLIFQSVIINTSLPVQNARRWQWRLAMP